MAKLLKLLGVVQHQQQSTLCVHRKVCLCQYMLLPVHSLTAVYAIVFYVLSFFATYLLETQFYILLNWLTHSLANSQMKNVIVLARLFLTEAC